ncbi:putative ankyrin repeat protein RBE_0317 [Mytilus edulis]|uniref:putative ankyrin repeat protein RBE_0317 n=1 Tax=Mytilus edulis TaxID=6550 RepID=UPI0039EFF2B8
MGLTSFRNFLGRKILSLNNSKFGYYVKHIYHIKLDKKDTADTNGNTPLHAAAEGGFINIVRFLLERADINPKKRNMYGNTPLHAAAEGGFINIVKLLLERTDIDPNKENRSNKTLLHSAARGGNLDIVELLLERADIDPNGENKVRDDVFLSYL